MLLFHTSANIVIQELHVLEGISNREQYAIALFDGHTAVEDLLVLAVCLVVHCSSVLMLCATLKEGVVLKVPFGCMCEIFEGAVFCDDLINLASSFTITETAKWLQSIKI